jgi:hypothetical protein
MHTGIWQILPLVRFQPPALSLEQVDSMLSRAWESFSCCVAHGAHPHGEDCHRKHMGIPSLQRLHDRLVASEPKGASIAPGAKR